MTRSADAFRYFDSSPEVIRVVVMMYVKYPLSLRNVEDLLFERGIDICHETVRLWWNRFGPMFAAEIRKAGRPDAGSHPPAMASRRGLREDQRRDAVSVAAVDHEGEVLESYVTKTRDKAAALAFIKRAMKRQGQPRAVVTDGLRSYSAAMREIGAADRQEMTARVWARYARPETRCRWTDSTSWTPSTKRSSAFHPSRTSGRSVFGRPRRMPGPEEPRAEPTHPVRRSPRHNRRRSASARPQDVLVWPSSKARH
jgi:transposase-like protein